MLKILMMDDSYDQIAEPIRELQAKNWKIQYAGTAKQALQLIDQSFDAAVLDFEMGDLTGFDVLEGIRQCSDLDKVCVIMLTARASTEDSVRCLREGAFDCLRKDGHSQNLERVLCSGIAWERAHALRGELLALKNLAQAGDRVRSVLHDVLKEVNLSIHYFTNGDGAPTPGAVDGSDRGFIRKVIENKRALLELDPDKVAKLRPVKESTKELLTAPILGLNRDVTGVIHLESPRRGRLDTDWKRVVSYLADLLGIAHETQKAVNAERRRVEELETASNEFAHRIATPLQPIIIQAQQLLEKDVPKFESAGPSAELVKSVKERVHTIQRNAQDIRSVTSHLSLIATAEKTHKRVFNAAQAIRPKLDEIREDLGTQGISIRFSAAPPPDGPALDADEQQIGYCLQCLLRNAVESIEERRRSIRDPDFNPKTAGDWIAVDASPDASGAVIINVSDTGTGVAEEYRDRIFEPLFSTKRRVDPGGIGLFSVRRIMTGLGGTITFKNRKDRGAVFSLCFPSVG